MAKYICPSCGAEFNGKKCKSCNYQVLEGSQKPRIYREQKKPKPRWDDIPTGSWEEAKKRAASGKQAMGKPPRWVIILLILFFGWPLLRFVLALLLNIVIFLF